MKKIFALNTVIPKDKYSSREYFIPLSPPCHLLIIHDGDDSGAMSVVSALRRYVRSGLCVIPSGDRTRFIMESLIKIEPLRGLNFSELKDIDENNYQEILPQIRKSHLIGLMSLDEERNKPSDESESINSLIMKEFILNPVTEQQALNDIPSEEGIVKSKKVQPSFLIMSGMQTDICPSALAQARALGCLCVSIVNQDEFLDPENKEIYHQMLANNHIILKSENIKSVDFRKKEQGLFIDA